MPPLRAVLAAGESPKDLLEAIMAGLKACGDRFEKGEYFLPELMGAGDAFKQLAGGLAVRPTPLTPATARTFSPCPPSP
jgi:methanogenic corrinoid protein MtbC1